MNTASPWALALKIPETELHEWTHTLPKNESLPFWCMLTGKIKSDKYLIWAKEYFQLITLNAEFFKKKPNLEFWNKVQGVANWSAKMIPLQEWDGVIFIGCIEPHTDVKWSFPVQYVLASAQDLNQYWTALHATPTIAIDEPAGLSLEKFANINAPKSIDLMEELARKIETTNSPNNLNLPDNLNWSPTDSAINIDLSAPEGFALIKQNAPPLIATPETTTPNENYAPILREMQNYFTGALILKINNENAFASFWTEPFKPINKNSSKPWGLNSPSALRVAFRTKQPYFGHIVDTPFNKEFFETWGFSELPKSVLIQPVIASHTVTHLLIAIVDESKKNHQTLHEGKVYADKISQLKIYKQAA